MNVVWDNKAKETLKGIVEYIHAESTAAAEKVFGRIMTEARSLHLFPEKFAVEPYLSASDKRYRFITVWSYKIIYRVTDENIRIVCVFHTKRNPDIMNRELAE